MIGLGWSTPQTTLPGACSGDQFGRTRAICAVSPNDDWIEQGCGCRSMGTSCLTTGGSDTRGWWSRLWSSPEGNVGRLFCCPTACPSAAGDGGRSAVQPLLEEIQRDEVEKDRQRAAATSPWPWVAVGGVLLAGFGGLMIYSQKKARREKMMLLMQLMEDE